MPPPTSDSPSEWLRKWLPLLSTLGLPVGGVWGGVAAFWKSATGEWAVGKRLLLVIAAATISAAIFAIRTLVFQRREIARLRLGLSSQFHLLHACYFHGDSHIDVTEALERHTSNGRLVASSGNHLGGDPAHGLPKILRIYYLHDGKRLTRDYPEGDQVSLP